MDCSDDALLCPGCEYDLRGIESERCPECGLVIDREAIRHSRVPWEHRKQIGTIRAFWRTVWRATFSPLKLGAEVARPVSLQDARLFRRIVIAITATPLIVAAIVLRYLEQNTAMLLVAGPSVGMNPPGSRADVLTDLATCFAAGLGSWWIPSVGILIYVICLSGAGMYFFHPRALSRERQNRAIAISHYASAPLAFFLPLTLLAWMFSGTYYVVYLRSAATVTNPMEPILLAQFAAVISLEPVLVGISTTFILRSATRCATARLLVIDVVLFVLLFVGIPLFTALVIAAGGFARLMLTT